MALGRWAPPHVHVVGPRRHPRRTLEDIGGSLSGRGSGKGNPTVSITGINRLQGRAYRSLGLLLSLLLLAPEKGVWSQEIVSHDFRNLAALPRCVVSESLTLGSIDGPDHLVFYQVEDAKRLPDGRIAVLNRGGQEVRMFGPDGSYLRSFGNRGGGPGEFRDPVELEILGNDSILVWDWAPRESLFSNLTVPSLGLSGSTCQWRTQLGISPFSVKSLSLSSPGSHLN